MAHKTKKGKNPATVDSVLSLSVCTGCCLTEPAKPNQMQISLCHCVSGTELGQLEVFCRYEKMPVKLAADVSNEQTEESLVLCGSSSFTYSSGSQIVQLLNHKITVEGIHAADYLLRIQVFSQNRAILLAV